jgi:hypothetical protein
MLPWLSWARLFGGISRAFKTRASAKQARPPSDRPRGCVWATRAPASLACSGVKDTAARTGLSVASHASSGLSPFVASLAWTPARLTPLAAAEQFGGQLIRARLLIENCQRSGSVRHNAVHFALLRGVWQSIRQPTTCPASRVCEKTRELPPDRSHSRARGFLYPVKNDRGPPLCHEGGTRFLIRI